MNVDSRWYLLIAFAACAVVGATVASKLRSGRHYAARRRDHAIDLKSWENEGGNLAPAPATAASS
jgi:hypothetical protein